MKVKLSQYRPGQTLSATGISATGISATGISATGISATGISATGISATGRIKSMKNSCYTIVNRNCNIPACSTMPQRTAPRRASYKILVGKKSGRKRSVVKKCGWEDNIKKHL